MGTAQAGPWTENFRATLEENAEYSSGNCDVNGAPYNAYKYPSNSFWLAEANGKVETGTLAGALDKVCPDRPRSQPRAETRDTGLEQRCALAKEIRQALEKNKGKKAVDVLKAIATERGLAGFFGADAEDGCPPEIQKNRDEFFRQTLEIIKKIGWSHDEIRSFLAECPQVAEAEEKEEKVVIPFKNPDDFYIRLPNGNFLSLPQQQAKKLTNLKRIWVTEQ